MKKSWALLKNQFEKVLKTKMENIQARTSAIDNQSSSDNSVANIDMRYINKKLFDHWGWFVSILPLILILSYLLICSVPRYYTTSTKLAPEIESPKGSGGAMSSIASSLGIDISNIQSTDAITPLLYPELMEDNKFITNLFNIKIITIDNKTKCDYFTYLSKYQKKPWWSRSKKDEIASEITPNPYRLTKGQDRIVQEIRSNIKISVNSKNGVITITTSDQDPLVCKTVTDSLRTILKGYITKYRTDKAKADYAYYYNLTEKAKAKYEQARRKYGQFGDANQDIQLQSYQLQQEELENDMQLKYNEYTTMNTQLQQAAAKIQEKTPVFTLIKGAEVPIKPAGPKRMIFALVMTVLAAFILSVIILRKDIFKVFA